MVIFHGYVSSPEGKWNADSADTERSTVFQMSKTIWPRKSAHLSFNPQKKIEICCWSVVRFPWKFHPSLNTYRTVTFRWGQTAKQHLAELLDLWKTTRHSEDDPRRGARCRGIAMDSLIEKGIWVCLKMLCTPLYPMVLLIIIPIKWLFHWEY